ncbi:pilus assembly protein PilZ [Pseudomonas oryzihabitans]|nr:pilus assembly protein PilZ [Pseudomonas psychrotolerans]KTS77302.1 pilus assembly protein PilZ [Pseudomonas psychrotolerans]KTT03556.1 pilus assembly protein PilZ [Pseudomonas psychrotolerans]KTT14348.1 pilus assembly protein PilZ [Pseudomonas psychrotolerans]KTT23375.1 pilus assembly protein PilZ [Pseudomonas psychrotolerans]
MTTPDARERREYYRITDRIALQISPADGVPGETAPLFALLSELHQLEFESRHLLRNLDDRDRAVTACLRLVHKRLDLLGQAFTWNLLHDSGATREVVLSEGGLAFVDAEPYALGTRLDLRMALPPQGLGLQVLAEVTSCQAVAGGHEIGTSFIALEDAQRQLLARHVLRQQARVRRADRGDEA